MALGLGKDPSTDHFPLYDQSKESTAYLAGIAFSPLCGSGFLYFPSAVCAWIHWVEVIVQSDSSTFLASTHIVVASFVSIVLRRMMPNNRMERNTRCRRVLCLVRCLVGQLVVFHISIRCVLRCQQPSRYTLRFIWLFHNPSSSKLGASCQAVRPNLFLDLPLSCGALA
jgi:hypothetical protein